VTGSWPHPEDDRFTRRTKVARYYRDVLLNIDAAACAEVDEVMAMYGQQWVFRGYEDFEADELLTIDQVAEWADVSRNTVSQWITRGHVERRVNADKQIVLLMADLIEYQRKRIS
jgi:hypothetical protein